MNGMTLIESVRDKKALAKAAMLLGQGELVAIPTETVYGLAADATNSEAVAKIYAVKGRPSFNPLIAHCGSFDMAKKYGHFSLQAENLAKEFWPGPLTLVLPYNEKENISPLVRAGLKTIALRIPKGPVKEIIKALGKPLAAPSANLSGRVSPTSADHVEKQLGKKIPFILDAGSTSIGLESTIIGFDKDEPVLLRHGGIAKEVLEAYLKRPLQQIKKDSLIAAPGMLASHYAPLGRVRLNALEAQGEEGALNFGMSNLKADITLNLSVAGDLYEAAKNLFSCLAEFDEKGVKTIAIAPIPETEVGLAINDRLKRAAAPK